MRGTALVAGALFAALVASCGPADLPLPPEEVLRVGPVEMYGLTLDSATPPEVVAYAALRAMRDEIRARERLRSATNSSERQRLREAQREALVRQLRLAAVSQILKRYQTGLPRPRVFTPEDRAEIVTRIVQRWAPTYAYFLRGPEGSSDLLRLLEAGPEAFAEQVFLQSRTPGEADVFVPATDPVTGRARTLLIALYREPVGEGYWRVYLVNFGKEPVATMRDRYGPRLILEPPSATSAPAGPAARPGS